MMSENQAAEKVAEIIASTIDQFTAIAIEVEADVEINATFKVNGKLYQFTIAEASDTNLLTQN